MIWEYLILALIVILALLYLWRTFFRKGGCSCSSCPSAMKEDCASGGLVQLHSLDGSSGDEKREKNTP